MKFIIQADLVRAAQHCQAKKDVRYYLCGIAVNSAGHIVGTNGHILFKADYTTSEQPAIESDLILDIDGMIPAAAVTVAFDIDQKQGGTCETDKGKLFKVSVIDGKFPDYGRIIPTQPRELSNSPVRTFTAEYLGVIQKVFGKGPVIIESHNGSESALIYREKCGLSDPGAIVILMPCRADTDNPKVSVALPKWSDGTIRDRRTWQDPQFSAARVKRPRSTEVAA